nr:hypothetical protein [Tanacetum cinerariifolium]
MTGNISYLSDFEAINKGYVAFGGNPKGGKITRKGKIRTGNLDFDDVYFVKELKFNLFSVSQMCDKKNIVLFTDNECIVLSFDFKLPDENHLCRMKRIKREFSVARTPQQNRIDERKNRTLIEAARTMLVDSLLPIPFWADAVNTACYVQNRVLVTKPHNKTPYELLLGKTPSIGSRPTWLFDIDTLNKSMNYQPVITGNQPNSSVVVPRQRSMMPRLKERLMESSMSNCQQELEILSEEFEDFSDNSTNKVNAASIPVLTVGQNSTNNTNTFSAAGPSNTDVSLTLGKSSYVDPSQYPDDPNMPALEDITYSYDEKDVEAIRLFLAYASFMGFMVYQMDVKSAFLYGTIKEEVYAYQPLGFEDPDYLDKRGKIDQTLFTKKQKGDILLVQVYVDDIIFGSTNKDLRKDFEKLMKDKFQMSSMGELTFFLGLQVQQKSMIGSLMYLNSSIPDIMFAVCACACFQVTPKASHLYAVNRIFRYLKGKSRLGLWYPKDSPFNLVVYSDNDYAGASLDRKSTTGGCRFLCCRLISW